MIIEGLLPAFVHSHNMYDPAVITSLQRSCRIHLLEVGYTADASLTTTLGKKYFQHLSLRSALIHAGWNVAPGSAGHLDTLPAPPFSILLLGTSGHIFRPARLTLLTLGLSDTTTKSLITKLIRHSIRSAHTLISLRRHLEWSSHPFEPP